MLVRSTRGCAWNRCRFCGLYGALGEPEFSIRPVADVKSDIDWYPRNMSPLDTAFIGDADPLHRPLEESVEILAYLRQRCPQVTRTTVYARASTVRKLGTEGMKRLAAAGLNRVHMGLESGDPQTLKLHFKGQSPVVVQDACAALKTAGIEVSLYVLLGLGGADRWREHIDGTVQALNHSDPEFIRIRRLWLYSARESGGGGECPLWQEVRAGRFVAQHAEGTVHELRRLVAGLGDIHGRLECDHANNYVQVTGTLPGDRQAMLDEIDRFLDLPEQARAAHYERVGSQI